MVVRPVRVSGRWKGELEIRNGIVKAVARRGRRASREERLVGRKYPKQFVHVRILKQNPGAFPRIDVLE